MIIDRDVSSDTPERWPLKPERRLGLPLDWICLAIVIVSYLLSRTYWG